MVEIKTGLDFVRVASKWKRLVTEPSHKPERVCVCACVAVCVRACLGVCACVLARVCVLACKRERERVQSSEVIGNIFKRRKFVR